MLMSSRFAPAHRPARPNKTNRESGTSWRDFLVGLEERGLCGVGFVVTDDHAGLKKAIAELLPEAIWQRCYVHFLRNALDYLPQG